MKHKTEKPILVKYVNEAILELSNEGENHIENAIFAKLDKSSIKNTSKKPTLPRDQI